MGRATKSEFDITGRITELLLKKGWTQYTLSARSGVPQPTIASWFTGRNDPSLGALEKICHGFEISLAEFFSTETKMDEMERCGQEMQMIIRRLNSESRGHLMSFAFFLESEAYKNSP